MTTKCSVKHLKPYPIPGLIDSDLYFCKNCNQGWKDNKWMECCKGCVGHRDMGWTIKDMKNTYGVAMDALLCRNLVPNYYFPQTKRQKTIRRLPFRKNRRFVDENILQPFVNYNLDWRLQQAKFLKDYDKNPSKTTWNTLDPEVQHQVGIINNIKF